MTPGKRKLFHLLLLCFSLGIIFYTANAYLSPRSSIYPVVQSVENNSELILGGRRVRILHLTESLVLSLFSLLMITYILALNRERRRYFFLLKNTAENIMILDRQGEVKECITGNLNILNIHDFADEEDRIKVTALLDECVKDSSEKLFRLVIHTEETHPSRYYKMTFQNMYRRREIRGIILTLLDVSKAKYLEQELIASREAAYREARHDMLTEIPNRLYFKEVVSRKFARLERNSEETMCLLMIDLDHFKKVNDTWGHDVGDQVLKELSVICSAEIRGSDMFARYGGEEFIVFLDDLNLEAGAQVAERMRYIVATHNNWPEEVKLTISIGAAEFHKEESLDGLIKKADIALYRAKALGRNQVCLSSGP